MATPVLFPRRPPTAPRAPLRRPLGDLLQLIAGRSPHDLEAFHALAAFVWQRLEDEDRARERSRT